MIITGDYTDEKIEEILKEEEAFEASLSDQQRKLFDDLSKVIDKHDIFDTLRNKKYQDLWSKINSLIAKNQVINEKQVNEIRKLFLELESIGDGISSKLKVSLKI